MKSGIIVGASLGLMAIAGFATQNLNDTIHPPQPPAGLDAQESSAGASLLGQFRTNVSSWLWVRTDLYLHNGVQMRPMTDEEKKSGLQAERPDDHDHDAIQSEGAITTVIPSKERDFRGIFGDIERSVGTYQDMHQHVHNDPKVAMPLFRLMTWIDPQFIPGWTTGAMVMARDEGKAPALKAIGYLKEGLAENPESIAILTDLGRLTAVRLRNLDGAVGYLEQAHHVGSRYHDHVPEVELAALNETYRWLGLCYRDLGEREKMTSILEEGLKVFPDDLLLDQMLNPPPSFLTEEGVKHWREERAAHR